MGSGDPHTHRGVSQISTFEQDREKVGRACTLVVASFYFILHFLNVSGRRCMGVN